MLTLRRLQVSATLRWMHRARAPAIAQHLRSHFAPDISALDDQELEALVHEAIELAIGWGLCTAREVFTTANVLASRRLNWIDDESFARVAASVEEGAADGTAGQRLHRAYRGVLCELEVDATT